MDAQTCFRTMFADLQSQLNPDDISAPLYSAGLLTKTELEEVNNYMMTTQTRATKLLSAVERAIHIDPKNFSKFLDILDKIHRYKTIVQRARASSHAVDIRLKQSKEDDCLREEEKNIEDLRSKMIENTQEIISIFTTFVLNTYRLLKEKQVSVDEINIALAYLCGNSQPLNLLDTFRHLEKYSSWFNYFPICYLAETFGGDQGKALMDSYEEQMKGKMLHRFAHQCPDFVLTKKLPDHCKELVMKIEKDYMFYTVQDLSLLRTTMARLLKLKPSTFILKSVEEGCVLLTWIVPISCSPIIPQLEKHATELEEHKIISVKTQDESEFVIRKGDNHLISDQSESKQKCIPDTPGSRDNLDVLSNNPVEVEILSVYSGSLNQGTSNGIFNNIVDNQPAMFWELQKLQQWDGTGLTIAFLDTGINTHHTDFTGRIKETRSFVDSDPVDFDGHGTTCAGIAAGGEKVWKDVHWRGVAPGVKIVMCKIAQSKTSVSVIAVVEALQFLIEKLESDKSYIDVLSISIGFKDSKEDIKKHIKKIKELGVIIVCAAGNHGDTASICFPASMLGDVLCIGAHDQYGKRSRFSPKGRELTFLAPGENIWAPSYNNMFSLIYAENGTSFSAPAVAGLICIILQRLKSIQPDLYESGHNIEIMTKILKTLSSETFDEEKGYGMIFPLKMLHTYPENVVSHPNI